LPASAHDPGADAPHTLADQYAAPTPNRAKWLREIEGEIVELRRPAQGRSQVIVQIGIRSELAHWS